MVSRCPWGLLAKGFLISQAVLSGEGDQLACHSGKTGCVAVTVSSSMTKTSHLQYDQWGDAFTVIWQKWFIVIALLERGTSAFHTRPRGIIRTKSNWVRMTSCNPWCNGLCDSVATVKPSLIWSSHAIRKCSMIPKCFVHYGLNFTCMLSDQAQIHTRVYADLLSKHYKPVTESEA